MRKKRTGLVLIFFLMMRIAQASPEFNFTGNFFSLSINEKTGSIILKSATGENVFSVVKYFVQYSEDGKKKDTTTLHEVRFKLSSMRTERITKAVLNFSTRFSDAQLTFDLQKENPELACSVRTTYKKTVTVLREAILFYFDVPVKEVYRKNRLMDDEHFQDEYWLDKEGVKFGTGKTSAFIYHAPGISSLQLNTPSNELIVNLDYFMDHPFLHFPFLKDQVNQKQDLSPGFYKAGQSRENSFSFIAGQEIPSMPRLMLNPDGFLSAYVFTEHADWTDLPSHRAVYFGSEEITNADRATGGFVKNKIPVTKSVFYANPDHVVNSQSTHQNVFSTPVANIKETEGFGDFLQQLNARGYEICLHTPDQNTSERPLLEEAIAYMKKNFNTISWIDHGYNNGAKNNREAFVCDGLTESSPSYAKDIWEKYGTKYFWNTFHEDFTTADSLLLFNSSQIIPYIGFGDAIPTPNYWQHPTRTGSFYSWCTRDLLEMPDVKAWSYLFNDERLRDFAVNRSIKFNHCYPAGGVPGKGFWKINDQKKIVVEPEFEKTLQRLAAYRDSGLIHLSTVRDMMNYWIACEQIRFDYLPGGKIKISNRNDYDVNGLSLAVKAKQIFVDGKMPSEKFDGNDLIFWFDLKAGGSSVIEPVKQGNQE